MAEILRNSGFQFHSAEGEVLILENRFTGLLVRLVGEEYEVINGGVAWVA